MQPSISSPLKIKTRFWISLCWPLEFLSRFFHMVSVSIFRFLTTISRLYDRVMSEKTMHSSFKYSLIVEWQSFFNVHFTGLVCFISFFGSDGLLFQQDRLDGWLTNWPRICGRGICGPGTCSRGTISPENQNYQFSVAHFHMRMPNFFQFPSQILFSYTKIPSKFSIAKFYMHFFMYMFLH